MDYSLNTSVIIIITNIVIIIITQITKQPDLTVPFISLDILQKKMRGADSRESTAQGVSQKRETYYDNLLLMREANSHRI